ncbi:MAG TPA: hypothetical protein VFD33_02975 [Bacillota bacterium]|nr:hypothetical protein [Bacillota bacterium]
MEKKDYLLGGRGIDTPYERDRIDYEPELEYKKEHEYSDGIKGPEERQLSTNEIDNFLKYSPSKTVDIISRAKDKCFKVLDILEERLKDNNVYVNEEDTNSEVYKEVVSFCGGPKITFQKYKEAIEESHLYTIELYEEYHKEVDTKMEALLYRSTVASTIEIVKIEESFLDVARRSLGVSVIGYFYKEEQELAKRWREAQKIKEFFEEEEREKEFVESILGNEAEAGAPGYKYSASSYQEALADYREFSYNPLPALSQMYYKRAEQVEGIAERTNNLLMYTICDSFHGLVEVFVLNILRMNDIEDSKIRKHIGDTINLCESLKFLIRVSVVSLSLDILSINQIAIGTVMNIIDHYLPRAIYEFGKTLRGQVSPVLNFLESTIDTPYEMPYIFNDFTESIVNTIDGLEKRFMDIVMEFYKIGLSVFMRSGNTLRNLEGRKQLSHAYEILDRVSIELNNLLSVGDLTLFSVDKFVTSLVSRNGWDVSYNPQTDNFERIGSVLGSF